MFVTRQDGLENSFCKHDATQTTTINANSPIVCQAGRIVTINGCDGETTIVKGMDDCDQVPFGFLMQEVRTQYDREYVPWGGIMARDRGTMREFVGGPVGVAHNGLYSTDVYDNDTAITAGDALYATASGTLCVATGLGMCAGGTAASGVIVARAMNSLTTTQMGEGRYLHIKALI